MAKSRTPRLTPRSRQSSRLRVIFFLAGSSLAVLAMAWSISHIQEPALGQSFTNVAISGTGNAGLDAALGGNKDGGFAWGDINMDGFLDLAVNTNDNNKGSHILIGNGSDPENPYFEDKTEELCKHCAQHVRERSAILADINHDGYPDFLRNTSTSGVFIYLNRGPAEGYQFGIGSNHDPNKTISRGDLHDGRLNSEGMFLADYDNNGWLDIILENHNYGIDIFLNPGDRSTNFTCLDPSDTGLPTSATDGDYGTCVDFDDDGDVDIIARKRNENDFFINDGNGFFTDGQEVGNAYNSNKGAVSFADFDNDGDYDLIWTDNDPNQIFLNDGTHTLKPTATSGDGEPWASAGVSAPTSGIDGSAVGDVNNDGKVDLFLTDDSGSGYLFINQTPDGGTLAFVRDNLGINVNGNGEGCAFADYDNDGDLDLYINVKASRNQLWRNNLNDAGGRDFLFVEPRIDLGDGVWRAAIGANIVLQACNGTVISGIREVPTTSGHGTDAPDRVHFGLPDGPDEPYNVIVRFLSQNGSRVEISRQITPSELSNQTFIVYNSEPDKYGRCSDEDQDSDPNWLDLDDDNDGIPDVAEIYRGDHDGDGTLDYEDADFCAATFAGVSGWDCADGLPDPSGDLDEDGVSNYADADFPTCGGLYGGVCANFDMDNDGLPNHLDLDSDQDGLPDLLEAGGTDVDGNGVVDLFIDSDEDGWTDTYDSFGDSYTSGTSLLISDKDGDGLPNYLDLDSDNDGLPDLVEAGGTDEEGDGRTDGVTDSDRDGFHDRHDATDNDPETTNDAAFAVSANAPLLLTNADTDGDGAANEGYTSGDRDGDGLLDHLDLDADNDGIPDLIESGGVDSDGDGRVDDATPDGSLTADIDSDGFSDTYDPDLNNDGDTNDAGDTGHSLIITSADGDDDGHPESYPDFDNDGSVFTALVATDADGDGIPNYLDLDADNDGIPDLVEAGGVDSDGDGKVSGLAGSGGFNSGKDSDNDGYVDIYDADDNSTSSDENRNTRPLLTSLSSGTGSANGHPALADVSGNSVLNGGRNADFDEDGIPNYLDLDSDNDGITDVVETFGYEEDEDGSEGQNGQVDGQAANDVDANGWHDDFEGEVPTSIDNNSEENPANTLPDYEIGHGKPDFDGDGQPNYQDIDADDDGIVDVLEGQASGLNLADPFDGLRWAGAIDTDYDGLGVSFDPSEGGTYIEPMNKEETGGPDFLDEDTDDDYFLDLIEGHDADLNGVADHSPSGIDIDLDGLDDAFDTNTASPRPENSNQSVQDGDSNVASGGDRDWRENGNPVLPVEWLGFEVQLKGANALVSWSTSRETSSDYFEIQRSIDGQIFESIDKVKAIGNGQSQASYSYTDIRVRTLATDLLYYQIRQVDIGGQFSFSSRVELSLQGDQSLDMRVFPNPTSGPITIEWNLTTSPQLIQCSLVSSDGKILREASVPTDQSRLKWEIDGLAAGVYVVRLVQGALVETKAIVVK